MSLIQEALQRKAGESGPAVSPPSAPQKRKTVHPGVWIVLLLVAFVATGVALWYLNPSFFRGLLRSREELPVLVPPDPKLDTESEPPAAVVEPPKETPAAAQPEPVPAPPIEIKEEVPAPKTPSPVEIKEKKPAPEIPPAAVPEIVEETPPPAVPVPVKQEPVLEKKVNRRWPALKLLGVLTASRSGSGGSAFLNNATVEAGDTLQGVRLLEVQSEGVWLEYQGERKYLRIGQSLP